MSAEPRLFRIDPDNRKSEAVTEVGFEQMGLRERRDIQEWVAANPRILGDDLLIVGKEFSGSTAPTNAWTCWRWTAPVGWWS